MSRMEKVYLGDGVWAAFDGWHVWLSVDEDEPRPYPRIALDPGVLRALNEFADATYKGRKHAPQAQDRAPATDTEGEDDPTFAERWEAAEQLFADLSEIEEAQRRVENFTEKVGEAYGKLRESKEKDRGQEP